MNRVLGDECQGKFAPKTRMTEIEEEVKKFEGEVKEFEGKVKEKDEVLSLSNLGSR